MLRVWFLAVSLLAVPAIAREPALDRQSTRYLEVLLKSPDHELARKRLWEIHSSNGSTKQLLEEVRSKIPNDPRAAITLGYLLIEAGEPTNAAKAFQLATDQPDTKVPALLGTALANHLADDPTSAAKHLEQALVHADAPSKLKILSLLSEAWDAAGETQLAEQARSEMLAQNPDDLELRRQLAESSSNPSESLHWLATHGSPQDRIDANLRLAEHAEFDHRLPDAIQYADTALAIAGQGHWLRPEIQSLLTRLHEQSGSEDTLLKDLQTKAKNNPRLWLDVAEIAGRLGRWNDQLQAIRAADSQSVKDPALKEKRAALEADFGSLDEAARLYDDLLVRRPNDFSLVSARANIDILAGRESEAETRINNWVNSQSDPNQASTRAAAFFDSNRMAVALGNQLSNQATAGNQAAAEQLAELNLKRGLRDEAIAYFVHSAQQSKSPDTTLRTATLLAREGRHADAASLASEILNAEPGNADAARLAATANQAIGNLAEAQQILNAAAKASPEDAPDLDRLLYEILNTRTNQRSTIESITGTRPTAPEVTRLAESLQENLDPNRDDEAGILRCARWLEWANQSQSAVETLREAAAAKPNAIEIREAIVRILSREGKTDQAIDALSDLSALAPTKAIQHDRTRAQLLADQGDTDAAISVLTSLNQSHPENVDILVDLAATQQRGGDWYSALETWRKAHQLADPSRQAQIRTSLLSATERLGMAETGIEFASQAAASATDPSAQRAAWTEALDLAKRKNAIPQLQKLLETTLAEDPNRMDALLALIEVAGESGDRDQLAPLIYKARAMAGNDSSTIRYLINLTDRFGVNALALPLARDLASSEDSFEAWSALASVQAALGKVDAALDTYHAIRRKFARDPDALNATADAFETLGQAEAAAECLALAAALDPPDPKALAAAGHSAMSQGDPESAIQAFQKLLAIVPPGTPTPTLPGNEINIALEAQRAYSIALQALGGMVDRRTQQLGRTFAGDLPTAPTSEAAALRLDAIRSLARLASGGAFRDEWLAACEANPDHTEAAWGFFEAGAYSQAMDRLALLNPEPGDDAERSFVWAGLIGGEWSRLRSWINANPDDRRRRTELLVVALSYALQIRATTFSEEGLAELFPTESVPAPEMWQIAWLFAAHSHFAEASILGDRVLGETTPAHQPSAALRLASWQLLLKRHKQALATLSTVSTDRITGFDHDALVALRMRWLLSQPASRPAIRAEIDALPPSPSAGAARILLMGLNGESKDSILPVASEVIHAWQQNRGLATDVESKAFSQTLSISIGQLMGWNMPEAAAAVIEAANQTDLASVALAEGQTGNWKNERDLWLAILAIQNTPAHQLAYAIAESLPLDASVQDLSSIAHQLDLSGFPAASGKVRALIGERYPNDPSGFADQLAAASRDRNDTLRLKVLQNQLASPALRANPRLLVDHATQLGLLALEHNRPDLALEAANVALDIPSNDERLLSVKDRALRGLDALDAREGFWREAVESNVPSARRGLARALQNPDPALLNQLQTGAAHPDDLVALLESQVASHNVPSALATLRILSSRGAWLEVAQAASILPHNSEVIQILTNGLKAPSPVEHRMACGIALLKAHSDLNDRLNFATTFHHLKMLADANPSHGATIFRSLRPFWNAEAPSRSWAKSLLESAWKDGRGNRFAGEDLVLLAIAENDAAAVRLRVRQFLDVNRFADGLLEGMAVALGNAGYHHEAALAWQTLWEFRPERMDANIRHAEELWKSGRKDDALSSIEPWLNVRWYDRSVHLQLARFYLATQHHKEAQRLFSEIAADDPGVSIPEVWIRLAELEMHTGQLDKAQLFLSAATRNPTFSDIQVIANWLAARSNLAALKRDQIPFKLNPAATRALDLEIATRLTAEAEFAAALQWLTPNLLLEGSGPQIATQIALGGHQTEIDALWAALRAEHPARMTARMAHAKYLRQIAESQSSLELLEIAASTYPEDVEFSLAVCEQLAANRQPEPARNLIARILAADIPPDARLKARQTLESL